MNSFKTKYGSLLAIVGGLAFCLMPARATPLGHLDVANCGAGGVTVGGITIDWTQPVGGGNGCIQTGAGTNVTFGTSSTLTAGVAGTILDLTAGVLPVANFMTFTGATGLHFDLGGLGPGSSNTTCTGLTLGNSCSAFAGSPFILTLTGTTATTVTLSAFGTAADGVGPASNWSGGFTTQIANMTPAQIQAAIAAGGSVSSTYSGDFDATLSSVTTPEPGSAGLLALGMGLLAFGFMGRRSKSKSSL